MNATLETPVVLTKSAAGKPPKRKILLVDDDPAICQMLRRLLAEEDFLVLTASNSTEVLELVKMTRFHLVLLDLKRPLEDEWETLGWLAAENPLLPVILISDRTDQFFHMLASGGALLERPLNPNKLFHTIHHLVAEPAEGRPAPFPERPRIVSLHPVGERPPAENQEGKLTINDTNDVLKWLRTINECRRTQPARYHASSDGKPVVTSTTTHPNVRFASISKVVPVFDETSLAIDHVPVLIKAPKRP